MYEIVYVFVHSGYGKQFREFSKQDDVSFNTLTAIMTLFFYVVCLRPPFQDGCGIVVNCQKCWWVLQLPEIAADILPWHL
jgi:hypothetical protein